MSIQGEIIKVWRKRHRISQLEFAKKTGIVQPIISYIEKGKRKPHPEVAIAIERATGGEIKKEWLIFPQSYEEEIQAYMSHFSKETGKETSSNSNSTREQMIGVKE